MTVTANLFDVEYLPKGETQKKRSVIAIFEPSITDVLGAQNWLNTHDGHNIKVLSVYTGPLSAIPGGEVRPASGGRF